MSTARSGTRPALLDLEIRTGRRRSGHALLVALLVLLLVSLALALVAASLHLGMRAVRQEARDVHLTALADAAVAEALANLDPNPDFRGAGAHPYGGGSIASEVTRLGTLSWRIEARAAWGGAERRVRVEVSKTVDHVFVSGWRRVR